MTPVERIQALIQQRTGISGITQQRSGIARILSLLASGSPLSLWQTLHQQPLESPIWQRLIHLLTISETYFLRDKNQFRILREKILPALIQSRRRTDNRHLTIGSFGCSTGEELYSIATILYELLPDISRWNLTLLGTDINQQAIATARAGIYREWSFRQVPDTFQARYFVPIESGWQIIDAIRNPVMFQVANLLDSPPLNNVDVLFCRHVLMYLNTDTACQVEQHLYNALSAGGWLILGQAEALRCQRERWTLHLYPGTPVYRRPPAETTVPARVTWSQSLPSARPPAAPIADSTAPYQQAVQALHSEQPAEAAYYLAQLLDTHPDHARGHTLLAAVFANRQAYPEARLHIQAALAAEPLLSDAHYIRGMIALENGAYTRSEQAFRAALYSRKNHLLAAFMLGMLYQQRGDITRARHQWQRLQPHLATLDEDMFLCDVSEMRAGTLRGLLRTHLQQTAPDSES